MLSTIIQLYPGFSISERGNFLILLPIVFLEVHLLRTVGVHSRITHKHIKLHAYHHRYPHSQPQCDHIKVTTALSLHLIENVAQVMTIAKIRNEQQQKRKIVLLRRHTHDEEEYSTELQRMQSTRIAKNLAKRSPRRISNERTQNLPILITEYAKIQQQQANDKLEGTEVAACSSVAANLVCGNEGNYVQ